MERSENNLRRAPIAILIAALSSVATGLLLWVNSGPSLWIEQSSYDSYFSLLGLGSDRLKETEAVIVYIDLDSHRSLLLDPARPWPRQLHAQLLERLKAAGARQVIFDVLFSSERDDHEGDADLEAAIRQHGHVWLAGELGVVSHALPNVAHQERKTHPEPPADRFRKAAEGWGLSEVSVDADFTCRRHFMGLVDAVEPLPSLTYAAAGPETTSSPAGRREGSRWLRYYGPPFSIPNVSFHQALTPSGVDNSFFRDRVVFIGARVTSGPLEQRRDEFRSPFRKEGAKDAFMPGVEVHATQMMNLLRHDSLWRLPMDLETLLMVLLAAVLAGSLTLLRSVPSSLTGGSLVLGTALGASWLARYNGLWFPWMLLTLVPIPMGVFGGSYLTDTLTWLRARARFRSQKRKDDQQIREQAALLDKARDAILVIGLDAKLLYANPGVASLYECSSQQIPNAIRQQFDLDSRPFLKAQTETLASGEWKGELVQQTLGGKRLAVESRWTLIRDEQGRPRSFLIINTDVTEKRTLEKEAHRAQRMETIGELAGGMAHDLNNALAPILMGVQLLRREEKDEHILRILSLIENNTHRGADMVRQVLFFARGREGESQALDLRSHIHEIERLIRETFTKNLSIHVQIAEDLWSVQGQPTQIHQILLNLCVNARDAMPHGGSLSIAADNVSFDADQSAAIPDSSPGEYVCLLVADTGTGISSELLPKIFDPFFTTKAEGQGTGLGLSTCARIAKSHGGFIRVESTPGEGTAFEVYLPRLKTASENLKPKTHVSAPRGNGETLLVVDDEDALRHVMRRSLEDYGYRVLVASNAAEALVQLNADNPSDIQLILCDLHMPGMNGAEFAIQLRQARPKLRVILMTGGATPAQSATSTPDLPYLTKPFDLDSALHRIAEVLKEKHDRG